MSDLGVFIIITILLATIIVLWVQYLLLCKKYLKALSLLRRMPEWVYDKDQECYFCEICGNNRDYGHADGCELAAECNEK